MSEVGELEIRSGESSVGVDRAGNVLEIAFRDKIFRPAALSTVYELDGEIAQTEHLAGGEGLSLRLTSKKAAGELRLTGDGEIVFHFEPAEKDTVRQVGLALHFPLGTVFHLAESRNIGRRLDSDMPIGECYRAKLAYNFVLAECDGMCIRLRTPQRRLDQVQCDIVRHARAISCTFSWPAETDACLAVFSSVDEALDDYEKWLEEECGMRKLRDRQDVPEWVHDIRLIITADMLRSNWEITHDYSDVLKVGEELSQIRDPKEIMFYIPGWQGAYDSTHPTYWPHLDLGGEEKFREMMDGLHRHGFRVMIHTTGWGMDPYHPDIDRLLELAVRNEEGVPAGWMFSSQGRPANLPMKFRTGRLPLHAPPGAHEFAFETPPIPGDCEALFTVGGIRGGSARISLRLGRRTISTPENWFEDHEEYALPFPLALKAGPNEIQVAVTGGDLDWSESWYEVRDAFVPRSPYTSWSWPILMGDVGNPEYVELFVDSVRKVVEEFGIDAVHVDATHFRSAEGLLTALREKLPGVAIAGEDYLTLEGMDYWTFCQGATQSLTTHPGAGARTREQASLPLSRGLDELFAWLDRPSPVCRFVKDYVHMYPHLCAANAFVPVGKVCNTFPVRQMPRSKEELWKVLRDAKRLDYIPGIRVNYRQYGLDDETRKAIEELVP